MPEAVLDLPQTSAQSLRDEGRRQARRFDIQGYQEAVALYLEARDLEPGLWASTTAALAETYALWGFRREISGQECASYYELAYDEAQQALEAAPNLTETHRAMAKALRRGQRADPDRRLAESQQAMKLNAYDAQNCHEFWCASGYQPDAPAIFQAMALDPGFFAAPNDMGVALYAAGRLQDAGFYFEKALKVIPGHPLAVSNWAMLLAESGQEARAQSLLRDEADPGDPLVALAWARILGDAAAGGDGTPALGGV
ncbi:MAG: hypothetical protein NTY77_03595 [Elusimicrobia bacterium]|nr:hypothetical protein [Elusimicrobiota bacterium]